jgi:hypothetical protein
MVVSISERIHYSYYHYFYLVCIWQVLLESIDASQLPSFLGGTCEYKLY